MATMDEISAAADRLDPEVPAQERGEFENAVAHALNLAQETDPAIVERLERDYGQLDPLQRKWYDRLVELLDAAR